MAFDRSYFANPLLEYLRWLSGKIYYQLKYRGKKLRIGYGSFVKDTVFGKYNWIGINNVIMHTKVGDYSYIAGNSSILHCTLGKFCSVGTGVKIGIGTHPTSIIVSTHPALYCVPDFHCATFVTENKFTYHKEVIIGNDVWIAANVLIVNGVKIGDGAIIAANSVVTKDVGAYEMVGGIPAKFIKKRFSDKQISVLKKAKWWDRSEEWIKKNISAFWDIEDFAKIFEGEKDENAG